MIGQQFIETLPREREGTRLMTATKGQVITLHETYDPNQFWLPFIDHVVFLGSVADKPVDLLAEHKKSLPKLQERFKRFHYPKGEGLSTVPHPDRDVPQLVIPFVEHKRVTHNQWKRLKQADFPGWERIDGRIVEIDDVPIRSTVAEAWLTEHCIGRFYAAPGWSAIYFSRWKDAVAAKLALFHGD